MRWKGSDKPPRQRALHRFQVAPRVLPNLRDETCPPHGSFSATKEAFRPIPGNTHLISSSTIIRSMFVSFLAILANAVA